MKKTILKLSFLFLLCDLTACAATPANFSSILEEQPYVIQVSPQEGSQVDNPLEFEIHFSKRIPLSGLDETTVTLLSQVSDPNTLNDGEQLVKDLQAKRFHQIPLQYFMDQDETVLTVAPDEDLREGVYYLVVTPLLQSVARVPFNQKPGQSPTPFVARYTRGVSLSTSGIGSASEPTELVISEILYDGLASDTDGENFVELAGTPLSDIGLYQILFVNGADGKNTDQITLPPQSIIPANGVFLIADFKTNSTTESRVPNANFLDQFDPQNGPDAVLLLNRNGDLLDSVVYGEGAVAKTVDGLALGEGSPALDVAPGHSLSRRGTQDSDDNAQDFVELEKPTPGWLWDENSAEPSPSPTVQGFGATPSPAPLEATTIMIHEVLYDAIGNETDGENFVELWGTPGMALAGFKIAFINGADGAETEHITIPAGKIMPADGFFVIADLRTSSTVTKVANADLLDNFDPQNGPDAVQLFDAQGNLRDSLAYGAGVVAQSQSGFALGEGLAAPDVAAGHSLSRVQGADSNDNARDFVDLANPTPGF